VLPSGIRSGTDIFTNREASVSVVSDLFARLPFAVVRAVNANALKELTLRLASQEVFDFE
jgi:hypothetical protein